MWMELQPVILSSYLSHDEDEIILDSRQGSGRGLFVFHLSLGVTLPYRFS